MRHRQSLTLCQWWRKHKRREYSQLKVCATIDTMLNFDNEAKANFKCEQALLVAPDANASRLIYESMKPKLTWNFDGLAVA